jgi:hypothetical protein
MSTTQDFKKPQESSLQPSELSLQQLSWFQPEFWGLKATITRNLHTVHWTCLQPTAEQPEKQTLFREADTGWHQVFCVEPLAQTAAESKFQINKSSACDFRCYASSMSCFCGPGRAQTEHLFGIQNNPDASACKHPWIPRAWLTAQACNWSLDGQITWRMRQEHGTKISLDFWNPMSGSAQSAKVNRTNLG